MPLTRRRSETRAIMLQEKAMLSKLEKKEKLQAKAKQEKQEKLEKQWKQEEKKTQTVTISRAFKLINIVCALWVRDIMHCWTNESKNQMVGCNLSLLF